jgi:hypothetical protein
VTARAILGLVAFNLFVLTVGAGVLWGVRGWRWWTDLVRLAGLAYLLGLSALMILLTFEIVVGIPMGVPAILVTGAAVIAVGVLVGRRRRFVPPGWRPPGWRVPGISLVAALFVAGIVVYFESLFRAQRLQGVAQEWDSWANWLPKAKQLYATGHLDPEFLSLVTPSQPPGYPPGPAVIQAAAFHAMGSMDTVTLHLQYWFMAAGFVLAVAGLLAGRVRGAILFPVLLALLVSPTVLEWIATVYSDLPVGYLVAVAALLIALWLEDRQTWRLAAATVLLSGAMLTKREGLLFAACVLLAAFVASVGDRRRLWRPLLVAGLAAFALALPWRFYFTAHGLAGDGPQLGYLPLSHLDVAWPALRLNVSTFLDPDRFLYVPALAVVAIVLAALAGASRIALYSGTLTVAAVAGGAWVSWAYPVAYNDLWPVRRFTAITVLVLAALTPLLLQKAWSAVRAQGPTAGRSLLDLFFRPSRVVWVVVLVGVLSHPGSMLLGYSRSGLPGGWPVFPGVAACATARVPATGPDVRVVLGQADSYPAASVLKQQALSAGLVGAQVGQDGCGNARVFVEAGSPAESQALVDAARAANLEPTLEGIEVQRAP